MTELKTKRKMTSGDKLRLARALTLIGNHSTTHAEGAIVSEAMDRFVGHSDIALLGQSIIDLSKEKPVQGMLLRLRDMARKNMLKQGLVTDVIGTLYQVGMKAEGTTAENAIGALLDLKIYISTNRNMMHTNRNTAENYYMQIETAIERIERKSSETDAEKVNSTRAKPDLINDIKEILEQTEPLSEKLSEDDVGKRLRAKLAEKRQEPPDTKRP